MQSDTIRPAFVAALRCRHHQRAVPILGDVLCWSADDVAQLLDTSVASANTALQRARSAPPSKTAIATAMQPMNQSQTELLARYWDAFERYDVETLVSLLHEDATFSMPPFASWRRGPLQICQAMLAAGQPCGGARLMRDRWVGQGSTDRWAGGLAEQARSDPRRPLDANLAVLVGYLEPEDVVLDLGGAPAGSACRSPCTAVR